MPKEYKQGKLYDEILNNDFAILILESAKEPAKKNYRKIELSSDIEVKDKIGIYGYPFEFS